MDASQTSRSIRFLVLVTAAERKEVTEQTRSLATGAAAVDQRSPRRSSTSEAPVIALESSIVLRSGRRCSTSATEKPFSSLFEARFGRVMWHAKKTVFFGPKASSLEAKQSTEHPSP